MTEPTAAPVIERLQAEADLWDGPQTHTGQLLAALLREAAAALAQRDGIPPRDPTPEMLVYAWGAYERDAADVHAVCAKIWRRMYDAAPTGIPRGEPERITLNVGDPMRCPVCETEYVCPESAGIARDDARRLDWMERHLCRAGEVRNDAGQTVNLCRVWSIMGELETLRETVDAAMTNESGEQKSGDGK